MIVTKPGKMGLLACSWLARATYAITKCLVFIQKTTENLIYNSYQKVTDDNVENRFGDWEKIERYENHTVIIRILLHQCK